MSKEDFTLAVSDAAAVAAGTTGGSQVTDADVRALISYGLLEAIPEEDERVLTYQVRMLGGHVEPASDALFSESLRSVSSRAEVADQIALPISRGLVLFFVPGAVPAWALRAFVRCLRNRFCSKDVSGSGGTLAVVNKNISVWVPDTCDKVDLRTAFDEILSGDARTSPAEQICVPSIYGNKSRISDFVVSTVRQFIPQGLPVCDLMTGTGAIARQLLATHPVYANDVAPFANCLARSQAVVADEAQVELLLHSMAEPYAEHFASLEELFSLALRQEESFLLGGLNPERLKQYCQFCAGCTRFVPGYTGQGRSDVWSEEMDDEVRQSVSQLVQQRRREHSRYPFLLTTAYWANCYFGVRQALEIDSLFYAIRQSATGELRELVLAVLLAAMEGCGSGPHFAQPPAMRNDRQIRRLLDRRSRSVLDDFRSRMTFVPLRPSNAANTLTVTQSPWAVAIEEFGRSTSGQKIRGVYADPPYSRLQYSRYYHVFDTLLRYDYPECMGTGRVSEISKRASSRFDSRLASAAAEIDSLADRVRQLGAVFFLSYSSGGTVPLEMIYRIVASRFREVHLDTGRVRHHSQGRRAGAKERVEFIFVGIP